MTNSWEKLKRCEFERENGDERGEFRPVTLACDDVVSEPE
jgi:hypothetical protein